MDRALGLVGGSMIVLAAVILVISLVDRGPPSSDIPPAVRLVAPLNGQSTPSPLTVAFTSEEPLSAGPMGWGVRGYHLHAAVNGIELMPAPGDVRRLDDGYEWTVGQVAAGETAIRLFWSDSNHQPILGDYSEAVVVEVR